VLTQCTVYPMHSSSNAQLTLLERRIDFRQTYPCLPRKRRNFIDQLIIRIVNIKDY
jgi:hypothetical protein